MAKGTQKSFSVVLISLPWAVFNRPSLQICALKAYLEKDNRITVDTIHPYLEIARRIGTETYRIIAGDSWAGEALCSPLLFPEQYKKAKKLFETRLKTIQAKHLDYDLLQKQLAHGLNELIDHIGNNYDLTGFSICFNQFFASLTAAKLLKSKSIGSPIVIGGSSCIGELGTSILKNFPQVDYVIDGEGEIPLHSLCLNLAGLSTRQDARIISRGWETNTSLKNVDEINEIRDLNTLPLPDYSQYFAAMNKVFKKKPFIPSLPIEFSRGCWWNKCRFCNLNLQWHHYRKKSAEQCAGEVAQLSQTHQSLNFTFTDNALPARESKLFFQTIAKSRKDFQFFAEIRAITNPDVMELYHQGGLTSIQVGIESLSTNLLKRMQKGTSAIDNIAVMRSSAETGIKLDGNLIIEFPGSQKNEVNETLSALDYVLPYNPLISVSFFLGYGSPIYQSPRKYHIRAVTQHSNNKKLYPADILHQMETLVHGYRGDQVRQRQMWKPVTNKIKLWHSFHRRRAKYDIPPLSYRDGGSFIIIRQEQIEGKPLQHRLSGTSRSIYLFCTTLRIFTEIKAKFPAVHEHALLQFLEDLVEKKLVFSEQTKYLSLAIQNPNNISRK